MTHRAALAAAALLAACASGSTTVTDITPPPDDAPAVDRPSVTPDAAGLDAPSPDAPPPDAPPPDVPAPDTSPPDTSPPDVPAPDVTACGAAGAPCCPGARCDVGVCAAGRCAVPMGCGGAADPCCAGGVCVTPLVCVAERCAAPVACGTDGAPCCEGARCGAGMTCAAGTCRACGAAAQPCCGAACGAGLVCASAVCVGCGMPSQPCCGAACVAGGVCVAGRCAADADRDGSPAGADCDDADPSRHPAARERCDGRDDDCDGAADEDACGLWFLPRGGTAWQAFPFDPARDADPARRSPDAPASAVRAAIDLEGPGVVYAFTDATYHVLDLTTRAWTASGPRDRLLPEAAGRALVTAYSVPASHPAPGGTEEGVTLFARDGVLNFMADVRTQAFRHLRNDPVPTWTDAAAPAYARVRLAWLDVTNGDEWVTESPAAVCPPGTTTATRVGPYAAAVTDVAVHTVDAGYCFRWLSATATGSFAPFRRPGAPVLARVGALFYRGGLWALAATAP